MKWREKKRKRVKSDIKFVIVTGISGAGKSQAIKCFEDIGFFCVDNLPTTLIPKFAEVCRHSQGKINKVALGIDIREGEFLDDLFNGLEKLKEMEVIYRIIFLEASDEILVRRFSETRRKHPLAKNEEMIWSGIRKEREKLQEFKGKADKIIDTSHLTLGELKEIINSFCLDMKEKTEINFSLLSFGYKYGLPIDVDIVMDVRFLPNPQYVKSLSSFTGNDINVCKFIMGNIYSKKFLKKFFDLIKFLLPHYVKEGKSYLTIAIGCTGGRHRSVVLVNELKKLLEKSSINVQIRHRDIDKN